MNEPIDLRRANLCSIRDRLQHTITREAWALTLKHQHSACFTRPLLFGGMQVVPAFFLPGQQYCKQESSLQSG